jgi:hypothetical protein
VGDAQAMVILSPQQLCQRKDCQQQFACLILPVDLDRRRTQWHVQRRTRTLAWVKVEPLDAIYPHLQQPGAVLSTALLLAVKVVLHEDTGFRAERWWVKAVRPAGGLVVIGWEGWDGKFVVGIIAWHGLALMS